jgi:two-component system NtrC family sensor kinase
MDRVLVIDDSSLVLGVMSMTLGAAGFDVETAEDGLRGLELLERFSPHVVVCDMNMPKMNGLEVMEALKHRAPLTPVLIFTDSDEVSLAVTALREGAFGYLLKGMNEEVLVREIAAAIEHRRLLERNRDLEAANTRYQQELVQMVDAKSREIARLQALKAHAEKMAAMGTFTAGIAHELNNPLSVVSANVAWARQVLDRVLAAAVPLPGGPLEELKELCSVIEDAETCTDRIRRIMENLRRFAHPGSSRATCELDRAVAEVKLMTRDRIGEALQLQWSVDPDVTQVGLAHDDLVSVLTNLVVNAAHAVQARGEGQVRVCVSGEEGAAVRIRVEDDGCGIPSEHLPKLCDPFFTTKPPGKGTGLGLSLVHQILRSVDGELVIKSEPGVGTCVCIRIPLTVDGANEQGHH